jgi:hypothetical protein
MDKLSELKNVIGSGSRANKYIVSMSIPDAVPTKSNLRDIDTLCKASSFPSVTIGQIEVFNQGRKLIIPGDTVYTNAWTTTFYLTESHDLRTDFISWMTAIDNFQDNTHVANPDSLMVEMFVSQLNSNGDPTAKYTFHNVFVQEVGEVALGDDTTDTINEFDVTFSFTDFVVE